MGADFDDGLEVKKELGGLEPERNKGSVWLLEPEGAQDGPGHSQLSLLKDWIHWPEDAGR